LASLFHSQRLQIGKQIYRFLRRRWRACPARDAPINPNRSE
jgi:hypothetical protein